eukprot:5198395-Pyramimonas_sp.AAC.1
MGNGSCVFEDAHSVHARWRNGHSYPDSAIALPSRGHAQQSERLAAILNCDLLAPLRRVARQMWSP